MAKWKVEVRLKHLLTEKEDFKSIKKSMEAIADTAKKSHLFHGFSFKKFYDIPEGDDVFGSADYANKLMEKLYDFADDNLIWID